LEKKHAVVCEELRYDKITQLLFQLFRLLFYL